LVRRVSAPCLISRGLSMKAEGSPIMVSVERWPSSAEVVVKVVKVMKRKIKEEFMLRRVRKRSRRSG
jgi:hypothetical protein